jgi:protoporphyrinogen oxidase
MSTEALLRKEFEFSDDFVDSFMRPWCSGMFFEKSLETSANYFQFVFKMLSEDNAAYPSDGMQAIPEQLASNLAEGQVRLATSVDSIEHNNVVTSAGERITCRAVVLAADASCAAKLLSSSQLTGALQLADAIQPKMNATKCNYYVASKPPSSERSLMLNGDQKGVVNHVFIPTNSVPSLSPDSRALISVSLVGADALEAEDSQISSQLESWFGSQTASWELLRSYDIPWALPSQAVGFASAQPLSTVDGVFLCGDYTETSSIHGAMLSGRRAAEAVASFLTR